MRFICTGDWHANSFSDYSRDMSVFWNKRKHRYCETDDESIFTIEMNSRLFNILNGLCDIRDYAVKNEIHHVLMAGDMFHKRGTIDVSVFNAVFQVLSSFRPLGVEVHAIAGNHDQKDSSQQPISAINTFSGIIHTIEHPQYFTVPAEENYVEVVALPYSKDKEFILSSMNEMRDKCDDPKSAILLCHLGVNGGKVGSGMYSMKDEYTLGELLSDKWKYVVVGHYHQPQLLSRNAIYTGTPIQNSFSDEMNEENDGGYNGFFVIDTAKRYDIQFIPIVAPRFITVSSAKELEKMSPEILKSNYVRVKSGVKDVDDIKEVLSDLLGKDSDVEVRLELEKDYEVNSRSEIDVSKSFEETVEIYAKEKYDGEDINRVIEVGLDILSEAKVGGN